MSIAFLDTETVTLEPGADVIWEIGVITRDGGSELSDREWRYQLRPNMAKANPRALEIGGFAERYQLAGNHRTPALGWSEMNGDEPAKLTLPGLALSLHSLLAGRSIFGICPSFDTLRLGLFLQRQFRVPGYVYPWHYQPHDVEDEVAGYLWADTDTSPDLFAVPRPTHLLAEAVGLDVSKYELHTALGDCRLARDMHDAVYAGRY